VYNPFRVCWKKAVQARRFHPPRRIFNLRLFTFNPFRIGRSSSAFFARMLAECFALTLTLSQREREHGCGWAALGLESLFSTSAFFARMLAEGLALTLTISHPASSRAARDYAGTRRERKLGCGWAALESLFSTSAFFARMLAEGLALTSAVVTPKA